MNFDINKGFKLYVQLMALALACAFIVLFTDFFPFDKQNVAYVLVGLFVALLIPLCGGILYVEKAKARAFKTRVALKSYPIGRGLGGRISMELQNIGDGAICISSAGFIDRHYERGGEHAVAVDEPVYSRHPNLPILLPRGESVNLEFIVDPYSFMFEFAGIFYEIDLHRSELNNKYARRLLEAEVKPAWGPQGFMQEKVIRGYFHKKFCSKTKWNIKILSIAAIVLILWFLFMVFIAGKILW